MTEVVDHWPHRCTCGHLFDEREREPAVAARHQVAELPPLAVEISEHRLQRLCCPECGRTVRAELPPGVPRGCFGSKLEAAIAALTVRNRLSRRQLVALMDELFGCPIAVGTIDAILTRTAETLAPVYDELLEQARAADALNVDETGWYLSGESRTLWGAFSKRSAVLRIAPDRGKQHLHGLIGDDFAGVLIKAPSTSVFMVTLIRGAFGLEPSIPSLAWRGREIPRHKLKRAAANRRQGKVCSDKLNARGTACTRARTYVCTRAGSSSGKMPANRMGRAGFEPATSGLKVQPNEAKRIAAGRNVLHLGRIITAASCSELRCSETNLYAHSYAQLSPIKATGTCARYRFPVTSPSAPMRAEPFGSTPLLPSRCCHRLAIGLHTALSLQITLVAA